MNDKALKTDLPYDGGLTCALDCVDINRSIDWYQNVLGLELKYHVEEIAWAELRSPVTGVTVGLGQVEEAHGRGGATLVWGTKDLDAFRANLEAKDVRFDGDTQEIPDMVRLATFYDPDGNKHMLYEDISPGGEFS